MNPVNGFTPEGLPNLFLSNMPVQSTVPGLQVTRPEIYFGELTNTDVYVKDPPAGVRLPARPIEQPHELRRHGRDPARWISAPHRHCD